MKKKMLAAILAGLMAFSLCACGGGETAPEDGEVEAATPVDLTGEWKMSNAKSDDADMVATITEDSISVSFVVEGDSYLYWSGSYVAPTEAGDTYKWTSEADGEAASALMGSSEETKDFSYNNGTLSFDVTIDGETATVEMEKSAEAPGEETEPNSDGFKVGETWAVDGEWEITVNSVTEVEERNEYSDKEPGAVYMIDYTYKNTGYEDANGIMDGLYIAFEDGQIVDANGVMGYSYAGNVTNYAKETPVGATCNAESCIGVDNPGAFKIIVNTYDSKGKSQSATFILEPAAAQ